MESSTSSSFAFLFFLFLVFAHFYCALARTSGPILMPNGSNAEDVYQEDELQTYIIQVEAPKVEFLDAGNLRSWYESFLPESYLNAEEGSRILHSYDKVFSGFSARLTKEEVQEMAKKNGFVRAYPDRVVQLLTTYSPTFLGLQLGQGLWESSNLGKGVVVGLLDTGVAPDHPSFDDHGVPPPPAKWKGSCKFEKSCNNKLIGASNLVREELGNSPFDMLGHGTHTASTAAGNFVRNASAFGLAEGTAAGMAPHAHVAIYKVCGSRSCTDANVLAGLDAAVRDGVDVLSISLGKESVPFFDDPMAIGAFAAVEKGVFVSCAGGNSGPSTSTVSNEAPWILTVAASTMNRSLRATVKLGDGRQFDGESLDQSKTFDGSSLHLFYDTSEVGRTCDYFDAHLDVKGHVVVCDDGGELTLEEKIRSVKDAGGVAVIFTNLNEEGYTILPRRSNFSAVQVSFAVGSEIKSYAMSVDNPTISIAFNGTVLVTSPAPVMAEFSSRGPSLACPSILKPDIAGPGVNILAAWPFPLLDGDSSNKYFNIISGTSMSTPHLSGIAALIKSAHPDWSPAAIKSAIMTTSTIVDSDGNPIKNEQYENARFFDMGAGHVNPSKATDPGLVYDLDMDDYIAYLCWKFGDDGVKAIVHSHKVNCKDIKNITESELNYPSILIRLKEGKEITVNRTVTNVGPANSTYNVEIQVPKAVSVGVSPTTLRFSEVNEKMTFSVSVTWNGRREKNIEGNLRWVSDEHVVRSPIVVA